MTGWMGKGEKPSKEKQFLSPHTRVVRAFANDRRADPLGPRRWNVNHEALHQYGLYASHKTSTGTALHGRLPSQNAKTELLLPKEFEVLATCICANHVHGRFAVLTESTFGVGGSLNTYSDLPSSESYDTPVQTTRIPDPFAKLFQPKCSDTSPMRTSLAYIAVSRSETESGRFSPLKPKIIVVL